MFNETQATNAKNVATVYFAAGSAEGHAFLKSVAVESFPTAGGFRADVPVEKQAVTYRFADGSEVVRTEFGTYEFCEFRGGTRVR